MTELQLEELLRRMAEEYPPIVNTAQAAEMLSSNVGRIWFMPNSRSLV